MVPDGICLKCREPLDVGLHLCGAMAGETSTKITVPTERMDFSHLSKSKAPWARAEYVGQLVGINKTLAYDLWPALSEKLQGDLLRLPPEQEAIQAALDLHFNREQEKARLKRLQEEEQAKNQQRWEAERRAFKAREKAEQVAKTEDRNAPAKTPLERIKVMLWAINKCGTTEAAKLAWNKAIKMAEEVDREQGKTTT